MKETKDHYKNVEGQPSSYSLARKERLMQKLDSVNLGWTEKLVSMLDPENKTTAEVLDRLTYLLSSVATLSSSTETNKYLRWAIRMSSYIFFAMNFYSSVRGLFAAQEDVPDSTEHHQLQMYFVSQSCRHETFSERSVINMDLFRAQLPAIADVKDIYEVNDLDGSLKPIDPQEAMKGYLRSTAYIIEFNGSEFLVDFNWKRAKTFEAWGPTDDKLEEFIQYVAAKLLQGLQKNMIEISDSNHYSFEDIHSLKLFDLEEPEFHDDYIYNNLFSALKTSMEKGLKTGVLLYGPPGVSKTTTVKYILAKLDAVKVKINNDGYKSAKKILSLIQTRKVVIIDDIDVTNNEDKDDTTTALLDFLDSNCYDVVIMIANTLNLSPVIIRSGRCDIKLECHPPDHDAREKILGNALNKHEIIVDTKALKSAVKNTVGMTHADLHNVVKTMARYNTSMPDAIAMVGKFIAQTAAADEDE